MVMSPKQTSLGGTKVLKNTIPDGMKLARVTNNDDYAKGQIQVEYLRDKGMPSPVWVIENGASRRPTEGDFVLIGFLDNEGNNPYLAGFYNMKAYTSNFIYIGGDKVRIQFPLVHADVYDTSQPMPVGPHLTNDGQYLNTRVYINLDATGLTISAPSTLPVNINGKNIVLNNGTEGVARVGDAVQVNLTTGIGTITGGSSTVKAG